MTAFVSQPRHRAVAAAAVRPHRPAARHGRNPAGHRADARTRWSFPRSCPTSCTACAAPLGDALAVVSGRPIEQLEALLGDAPFALAGEHGGAIRFRPGGRRGARAAGEPRPGLAAAGGPAGRDASRRAAGDKQHGFVLHYRAVPELGPAAARRPRRAAARHARFTLLPARKAWEVRPAGADKGTAVAALMRAAPFAGRLPLFIGDDVTDEDAIVAAAQARRRRAARARGVRQSHGVRAWLGAGSGDRCMARLVIVSNRVPPPRERGQLAGGLAIALRDAIRDHDTLWFGWSGSDRHAPGAASLEGGPRQLRHRRHPRGRVSRLLPGFFQRDAVAAAALAHGARAVPSRRPARLPRGEPAVRRGAGAAAAARRRRLGARLPFDPARQRSPRARRRPAGSAFSCTCRSRRRNCSTICRRATICCATSPPMTCSACRCSRTPTTSTHCWRRAICAPAPAPSRSASTPRRSPAPRAAPRARRRPCA